MKTLLALLLASSFQLLCRGAESYSTEINMTSQKDKGVYEVVVQVSELHEQDGKITEKSIGQPRLQSPFGSPSSIRIGPDNQSPDFEKEPNVTVDVSWPKQGEPGAPLCTVTIKRGDKVVSRSKLQFSLKEK